MTEAVHVSTVCTRVKADTCRTNNTETKECPIELTELTDDNAVKVIHTYNVKGSMGVNNTCFSDKGLNKLLSKNQKWNPMNRVPWDLTTCLHDVGGVSHLQQHVQQSRPSLMHPQPPPIIKKHMVLPDTTRSRLSHFISTCRRTICGLREFEVVPPVDVYYVFAPTQPEQVKFVAICRSPSVGNTAVYVGNPSPNPSSSYGSHMSGGDTRELGYIESNLQDMFAVGPHEHLDGDIKMWEEQAREVAAEHDDICKQLWYCAHAMEWALGEEFKRFIMRHGIDPGRMIQDDVEYTRVTTIRKNRMDRMRGLRRFFNKDNPVLDIQTQSRKTRRPYLVKSSSRSASSRVRTSVAASRPRSAAAAASRQQSAPVPASTQRSAATAAAANRPRSAAANRPRSAAANRPRSAAASILPGRNGQRVTWTHSGGYADIGTVPKIKAPAAVAKAPAKKSPAKSAAAAKKTPKPPARKVERKPQKQA